MRHAAFAVTPALYTCSQIHTYLSTHGVTLRGKDQAHADDTDASGRCAGPRKCPRILNDWTQAQPWIDKGNRFRQRILAIEERFTVHSYPLRSVDSIIIGMSISSAYTCYQYFVSQGCKYATFRDFVDSASLAGMQNTWDFDHAPAGTVPPPPAPLPVPAAFQPPAANPPGWPAAAHLHLPMSISQVDARRLGRRKPAAVHPLR